MHSTVDARKGHSLRALQGCPWHVSRSSLSRAVNHWDSSRPYQRNWHSIRSRSPSGGPPHTQRPNVHSREKEPAQRNAGSWLRYSLRCGPAVPFELGPCTVGMHLAQKVDVEELPSYLTGAAAVQGSVHRQYRTVTVRFDTPVRRTLYSLSIG